MLRIPKELHLYWNGSPMSRLQTFTAESFHRLNPDWRINLYIPKQAYKGNASYIPDYTGPDYFSFLSQQSYINVQEIDLDDYGINHEHHDILRSDIFRYHKLYEVGGVWSDFDVLWLKPMSEFVNVNYIGDVDIDDISAVISFIGGTGGGHSIGIMIHCKHDPYMLSIIEAAKKVEPPFSHEIFGATLIHSVYPTLDSIKFVGVVGTHHHTYYPYNIHPPVQTISQLYMADDLSCIDDNVMCLHWYNGHPLSKAYLNNNGFAKQCSMTTLLKQQGYI